MCGIIGGISIEDIVPVIIKGLKRLEYRGYDSAGIAIIDQQHKLSRYRALGKIEKLAEKLSAEPLSGHIGIAHTRWATHGKPSEENAHPHVANDQIAIVHNGIIENHQQLREKVQLANCKLTSETDSELIAHLISLHLQEQPDFLKAVYATIAELKGAYAIAVINVKEPQRMIVVRSGSPLVVSKQANGVFVASDVLALLNQHEKYIYLEEGDVAEIFVDRVNIYDKTQTLVKRTEHAQMLNQDGAVKGKYKHFMLKEIFDQPHALTDTLQGRISDQTILVDAFGPQAEAIFKKIKRVQIVACGTSFHAGLVARRWFIDINNMPCHVEIASEFRYQKKVIEPDTLFVAISQSGETADTLAALRLAKENNYLATLAICNVGSSSLVREADLSLMTQAGPEIGVASTKAFTTQLTALLLLVGAVAKVEGNTANVTTISSQLSTLPNMINTILKHHLEIKAIAKTMAKKQQAFFLGRDILFPIAMEGALKLKEISYIHAEAYPAGELKHGPLALIDSGVTVIVLVPNNNLINKLRSSLEEVHARGGHLIIFTDEEAELIQKDNVEIHRLPILNNYLAPIGYAIPLQLLAYYVAAYKGTDIDQPRNLAKSVTVE